MMKPSRRHAADSPSGEAPSPNFQPDFAKCSIATYIISKQQNEKLTNRNGSLTELGHHLATKCPDCLHAQSETKSVEQNKNKNEIIELSPESAKYFRRWIKKNHQECLNNLGEAIRLLTEYYDYAYYTMRPELIRYKQQYGELRK